MKPWWLGLLLLAACAAPVAPVVTDSPPPEERWVRDGTWWCFEQRGQIKWCETDDPRVIPGAVRGPQ